MPAASPRAVAPSARPAVWAIAVAVDICCRAIYAKYWERPRRTSVGNRLRHPPSYSLAMNGPYYIRSLDNLRQVLVMYLCGSPCISVCVSLCLWVFRRGDWGPKRAPCAMEVTEGPPVSSPDPALYFFCGTTGVELDSRRDGHAIWQSDSTDPHSTD